MFVHRSNQVEALLQRLVEVLDEPVVATAEAPTREARVVSALQPEVVVVQSQGMARWLSLQLAQRRGVCANVQFPFPRGFVDHLLDLTSDEAAPAPHARGHLAWAICRALPEVAERPEAAAVKRFLTESDGPSMLKRVDLAGRIADLFDQYAVYRPEMILEWEGAGGDGWQPQLYRASIDGLPGASLASRAAGFLELGEARLSAVVEPLPPRLCVFGISSLPPLFLRILAALGRHRPLHLFVLAPSAEYVAEVRSHREILREWLRHDPIDAADLHLSEGHPLIASLGKVGQQLQWLLEEFDYQEADGDLFQEPPRQTLLGCLQSDMLHLQAPTSPSRIRPEDRTIAVASCHGKAREVEVLKEELLARFEADATLSPGDVLVMTTDIEAYAPLIEATFGSGEAGGADGAQRIPYCIADRPTRSHSPYLDAFLAALRVVTGRMKASEVFDLLQRGPVQRRFGLAPEALPVLQRWVRESGVRWGADPAHRASHGQPEVDINTWAFGLRRLFLGFSLSVEDDLFQGVVPFPVEGVEVQLLGGLAEVEQVLARHRRALAGAATVGEWSQRLLAFAEALLLADEKEVEEQRLLREQLLQLETEAVEAGFEEELGLDALLATVEERLTDEAGARAFLAGGVTFCAMLPMRSIPFRMVCVLGLDDGVFPRADRRLGFDLIAASPRTGDRNLRDEDRYVFLEAVLSAREQLYLSYVGRSIQDDARLPPSVVLGELIDVVEGSYEIAGEERSQGLLAFASTAGSSPRLTTQHPLQPFSPRYFRTPRCPGDERLVSASRIDLEAAQAVAERRDRSPPLLVEPLPPVEDPTVTLAQLQAFYDSPCKAFSRERLGVQLDERAELVLDREPLELDALERYQVGAALVAGSEADLDAERQLALARGRGILPPGTPGTLELERHLPVAEGIAALAESFRDGPVLVPRQVVVGLPEAGVRLEGTLDGLAPGGRVVGIFSQLSPKHRYRLYLRHLVLCALTEHHLPGRRRSALVGRGDDGASAIVLGPLTPDEARLRLTRLVEALRLGQRLPLPFVLSAAVVCAEALAKDGDDEKALEKARKTYKSQGEFDGASSPYVQLAFGDGDPTDPEFLPPGIEKDSELQVPSFLGLVRTLVLPMVELEQAEVAP